MPLKSFVDGLKQKVEELEKKRLPQKLQQRIAELKQKRSRAIVKCPKALGDIVIGVYRADTGEPIEHIPTAISGTSKGNEATDADGLAIYPDRPPGPYHYEVTYPPKYAEDDKTAVADNFTLGAAQVMARQSSVSPTGKLRVTVRLKGQNPAVLPAANVLELTGVGAKVVQQNPQTFVKLRPGPYTVTARVTNAYSPQQISSPSTPVEAHQTAEVILEVAELAWIKLRVHDQDRNLDLTNVIVEVTLPDATRTSGNTSTGEAQFLFPAPGANATVELRELITQDTIVYELVDFQP